jgi:hypothetical protein
MSRTKKPPSPLEKVVQKSGNALLEGWGWEVHRRNTGVFRLSYKNKNQVTKERIVRASEPGQSDTYGKLPDRRRFELEYKRFGERPTPKQLAWLKSQNDEHCVAFWVDNTHTLFHVAKHLMAGGSIEYGEDDHYELTDL